MFHTPLCHTIFHTTLSHALFHTQLSHTHTHHLSHTTLSHTIFHTQLCHTHTPFFFVTHHLSHTTLSHTTLHIQLVLLLDPPSHPLSFLPSPSPLQHLWIMLEEIDLWGFPVLYNFGFSTNFAPGLLQVELPSSNSMQPYSKSRGDQQFNRSI